MSLKSRLTTLLHEMRDHQLGFADHLSDADREAVGTAEDWSARDMLVHNMVWAQRHLADLETLERGEPWPAHDYDDFDDANREIFEANQGKSWTEVEEMIRAAYAHADAYLGRTSEETLLSIPEGPDRPVWRAVAGNWIMHPMIHLWEHLLKHGYNETLYQWFDEPFFERLLAVHDDDNWRGTTYYNLGCILALTGQTEQAIERVREALRLSPGMAEWAQQDSDLDSLRDEPAFQALFA